MPLKCEMFSYYIEPKSKLNKVVMRDNIVELLRWLKQIVWSLDAEQGETKNNK